MKKWNKKDGSKKRIALGVAGAAGAFVLGASLFTAVPAVAGGFGLGPGDGTGNNATTQAAVKTETSAPRAASDRACPGYWDTDGDGICDTCGAACAGVHSECGYYVDEDGDGVCDHCAKQDAASSAASAQGSDSASTTVGNGGGANYVDANGDGVCDNYGTGAGNGGANYVDANGDGICDNYGTGAGGCYGSGAGNGVCDGTGQGYGYGTGNGSGQGYGYGAASGGHHGNGGGHHGRC